MTPKLVYILFKEMSILLIVGLHVTEISNYCKFLSVYFVFDLCELITVYGLSMECMVSKLFSILTLCKCRCGRGTNLSNTVMLPLWVIIGE